MLRYKRPAYSKSEKKFIHKFIDSVPGICSDSFGNRFIKVGEKPRILFSSHTDTVHFDEGIDEYIVYSEEEKIIITNSGDVLGADNCSGIYLMLEMIKHNIEGLYIFNRDEEFGGNGSKWIAKHNGELLDGIDIALAFDRRGNSDIVTHQLGKRTASNGFAHSLAKVLKLKLQPVPGIITDTANYSHLIPECSNISVGYQFEHSPEEYQDAEYLDKLLGRLLSADYSKLQVKRRI